MSVAKEVLVHFGMSKGTEPLSANIGYEGCVKREMTVNFFMSTIWPRCLNATSSQSLVCCDCIKNICSVCIQHVKRVWTAINFLPTMVSSTLRFPVQVLCQKLLKVIKSRVEHNMVDRLATVFPETCFMNLIMCHIIFYIYTKLHKCFVLSWQKEQI